MNRPEDQHDPGGKVRLGLPEGVIGDAVFSDCGRYRHSLVWDWTRVGHPQRTILFVGQNPSVAGADVSDPTCSKELGFAIRWGFTRYIKTNMLDWRATHPRDVPQDPSLARSSANLAAIVKAAEASEEILLGYGRLHKRFNAIVEETLGALRATGKPINCLKLNQDGSAHHPLYLRNDTMRFAFPIR